MTELFLDLMVEDEARLIAGARDSTPVSGFTHGFYKYPARFSPAFARAAIQTFTEPGDVVLDPHVGGGTSLVEAIASGRHAIGIDISELAEFGDVDADCMTAGRDGFDQTCPATDMRIEDNVTGLGERLDRRARERGREAGRILVEAVGEAAYGCRIACACDQSRLIFYH